MALSSKRRNGSKKESATRKNIFSDNYQRQYPGVRPFVFTFKNKPDTALFVSQIIENKQFYSDHLKNEFILKKFIGYF